MSAATEGYNIARTLATLEVLAGGPCSTPQVADALSIHVRTARRMLSRLVYDGYAEFSGQPRPKYSLSPRFAALARRALQEQARRQDAETSPPAGATSGVECVILAITSTNETPE